MPRGSRSAGRSAARARRRPSPSASGATCCRACRRSATIVNLQARRTGASVPAPTPEWAEIVYPELPSRTRRYDRFWEAIAHICRLDADDPVGGVARAHGRRSIAAQRRSPRAQVRRDPPPTVRDRLDASGSSGRQPWEPPSSRRSTGSSTSRIFRPKRRSRRRIPIRVDGHVSATMPLELYGPMIRGLRVEFAAGRVTRIDADENAGRLERLSRRTRAPDGSASLRWSTAPGASGRCETVFFDTLLDENAASHIALGIGLHAIRGGRGRTGGAATRARSTSTS